MEIWTVGEARETQDQESNLPVPDCVSVMSLGRDETRRDEAAGMASLVGTSRIVPACTTRPHGAVRHNKKLSIGTRNSNQLECGRSAK